MAIEVKKLGDALLAEVVGVDISAPIDTETWGQINQAFLDHCVLAFRGQTLTLRQMLQFEENFGPVEPHITLKYRHPEVDELIVMSNLNDQKTGHVQRMDWRQDHEVSRRGWQVSES